MTTKKLLTKSKGERRGELEEGLDSHLMIPVLVRGGKRGSHPEEIQVSSLTSSFSWTFFKAR